MMDAEPEKTGAKPGDTPRRTAEPSVLMYPLGTIGAIVGALLGALIMKWGWQSGFYAEPAVGILAGLAASWLAPRGGWLMGIIAGVVTLAVGLWAEWKFIGAMKADDSFAYFLTHVFDLTPFKLVMGLIDAPLRALQKAAGLNGMAAFFLLPNMAIFGIFVLLPLVINFVYSLTGGTEIFLPQRQFVGMAQYQQIFS